MKHFIPYALHLSTKNNDGSIATGRDADGQMRTGRERPLFDTLIGVCNPHPFNVRARFSFFKQDGSAALWENGSAFYDYILQGDQSIQMTLIPGNPFPGPPADFLGHAIVEVSPLGPFGSEPKDSIVRAALGGSGFWPRHWNEFCAETPVIKGDVPAKHVWRSPYAIKFRDANHTEYTYREKRINPGDGGEEPVGRVIRRDFGYETGLVITNFDNIPAALRIRYKVGQAYLGTWQQHHPGVPTEFVFDAIVNAGCSLVEDLFNKLQSVGYPANENSEGFVEVRAIDGDRRCAPYLLISNKNYDVFAFGICLE